MTDCEKWLADRLKGQVFINCERIKQEATDKGYTRGQLNAARKRIGVATISDLSLHEAGPENWFWLIPKEN